MFSLVLDDRIESEMNALTIASQCLAVKGTQFFQPDETGRIPDGTGRVVSRKQLVGTAVMEE